MAGTFIAAGAPAHTQDSLPSLAAHMQSDTHLTSHLASRFHVSLPTTRLSSHALVSFNTYAGSSKGPDGGKEGSNEAAAQDLAARAYARLGARGENQAIIFLGESGAGKTTMRSHVLSGVLNFSSTPISKKLSFAAFVFDTLTTTKSLTSPVASKAGLFLELQYDTASSVYPTLIGGKLLDHRLERSRIASVPTGERSFHVLYYLLAGTSAAEKSHLGLDLYSQRSAEGLTHSHSVSGQKRWRYLGHPTQLKIGIDDDAGFKHFKTSLRKLEFSRNDIAEICQILASILHIGQLEFHTTQSTTPAADDSGGYSHEGGESVTTVKNKEVLSAIAAFLGVNNQDLEQCLGFKTQTIHRERVTVMLDPQGARENADELARTLYTLLVAYVVENVNQKISALDEAVVNTISMVDFPGFAQQSSTGSTLDQLLNNAATESLYNLCLQSFFERKVELLESEEISVPQTSYFDNSDAVRGLLKPGNGLLAILDDQMRRGKTDTQFLESLRKRFENKNPAIEAGETTATLPGSNFPTYNANASFTVRHWAGEVEYPVEGLLEENREIVSNDFMNMINATRNDFVRSLFGQEALQTVYHPKEKTAIMQAHLSSKPSRKPSMAVRKANLTRLGSRKPSASQYPDDEESDGDAKRKPSKKQGRTEAAISQGAAAQFLSSLDIITKSICSGNTNPYFIFCLKPNDRRIANQFDSKCVRNQMQTLGIAEMSQRLRNADFSVFLPFAEFLGLAETDHLILGSESEKAESIIADKAWPANEARVGSTGVLLSERLWAQMAKIMTPEIPNTFAGSDIGGDNEDGNVHSNRIAGNDSKVRLLSANNLGPGDDKPGRYLSQRDLDTKSEAGASAFNGGDMFRNFETREEMAEKGNEKKMEEVDDVVVSGSRKRWMFFVWLLTFYIPDFAIKLIGRIPRKDVRTAWREKLAINLLIWFSCGVVIFFIVIFPELICPRQHVYTQAELSHYDGKNGHDAFVAIRGIVFDLGSFANVHQPPIIPQKTLMTYAGKDATSLFPVQVSAMCQGKDGTIDESVQINFQGTNYTGSPGIATSEDFNYQYHDFRWSTGSDYRPDWFTEQMLYLQKSYFKGNIGFPPKYVKKLGNNRQAVAYINKRVYDFTSYVANAQQALPQPGQNLTTRPDLKFMDQSVVDLFARRAGHDVTKDFNDLNLDPTLRASMQICMDNLFYVGNLDTRSSTQCLFARYVLLAISILLVSVIGFKFLAALQFGKKNIPENLDKFVICTVPAYTEDEESLRRAIDSAARMRYDDKRKLLFIICDGMIIGQGNDRPTPRIVLDILGVPEGVDPEPLSFESLGEGMKQHNMGKVYSGLYEVQGHIVPFLVVVKIGKPSEVTKPGNRGKRDSQMVLMRFLNRVHYNLPMTPLELEMHHQIRNIIGVNPTFYEFILQIDADTVVAPDSATRMVASFLHDTRLIGVCGETALTNAKSSFVTMMQVYEYYISHNLTKAFESLFGSVTCLPGCFTMYRVRDAETGKPLFVSREIIEAYSEIRVDTLHMKNLLHLGEDRFLTTLLIKFHSKYKTKYIFRAHAWTIAPDSWAVFLSQRRRWINSTVHNLIELIPLQQLCGFCCFSMRFVVFLDLLSTIVQPALVGYIVYLLIEVGRNASVVPVTAFILLGAIYGLQAIIFIVRRKWEMIGWMLIYIAATPIFAAALPLYSFWHMDDFSWGNTRVVTGEKGRQVVVSDEGKFDPKSIPRKRWEEYQSELWEAQTQRDDDFDARSQISGVSYATKAGGAGAGYPGARSEYNPKSDYGTQAYITSRPVSTMPPRQGSAMSMTYPSYPHGAVEMIDINMPSDDQILNEIRDILRTADLMNVTKKSVKLELERRFGVQLDAKRAYIGSATEAVLSGQL